MKVLLLTYELPPIGGGGGRAAWHIARRLAVRHEVRILTSRMPGLQADETIDGVHIHRIRVRRKKPDAASPLELLSFMLRGASAGIPLARLFGPDVILSFFAIPGGRPALRIKEDTRTPYVLALRGSDVPRPELARYQRLHLFTKSHLRRVLSNADAVTAVSENVRDAAVHLLDNLSIEVIPNGVDAEFFRPNTEPKAPGDPPTLLFAGRLQPFKGVQRILAALPSIEEALGKPLRLQVVGDGPQRPELECTAAGLRAEGLESEVRFTGRLDQERLRDAYAAASVLVLPSLVEGSPNVLLEALAMGLPCAASDVPGIREVLEDSGAGILFNPTDEHALARAVADILSDTERYRRMAHAARAKAEQCSWDKVAGAYETVLERTAAGGTGCGT